MGDDSSTNITSPQSGSLQWNIERVKLEVAGGSVIRYGRVVDIGNGILVKYGTHVNLREAEATKLVATHTSVPVPEILAALYDDTESVTYIVQTKLPGRSLASMLPTLTPEQQAIIEQELRETFRQLSTLDTFGPMGMVGKPSQFLQFHPFGDHGPWEATTLIEFLNWPIKTANAAHNFNVLDPVDTSQFDFEKPHIFSHGDLVPENILIHDGHVSGIVDWEHAGWYPYFWNAYIAQRRLLEYPNVWRDMVPKFMTPYREDWIAFYHLFSRANMYL